MTNERAYRFSSFRLDPQNWRLRKNNEFRPLRPKTFAILRHLLDNAGQLVTKEDLFQAIWPGLKVENSALRVCMNELRQALDDDPHRPRFVETVHRLGYRFIAPVDSGQDEDEEPARLVVTQPILVGREAEQARLLERWERALTGTRQTVFITGEPGIGKTTLVDKLIDAPLVSRFALVGRGQCPDQHGKNNAYLPMFEALSQLCGGRRGKNAREVLLREAESWAAHMPQLGGAENSNGGEWLPAPLPRRCSPRSRRPERDRHPAPVLLMRGPALSDRATVELIDYLARRRDPARLMLVGTFRSTLPRQDRAKLAATVRDLRARQLCDTISLRGLNETEVADYLYRRIDKPLSPKMVNQVYRRTGGNPLFLTAMVDHLEALGATSRPWPDDLRELGVPETVNAMVEQQIEELSEEDRKVLKLASVAGASGVEFSAAGLAAALQEEGAALNQDQVEEQCEQLSRRINFLRAAGVAQWPDGTIAASYVFGHALYQEVLYSMLSAGQRARAHLRIARRLAEAYGVHSGRIAAELATHFERGGDAFRAAEHLNGVADIAISRGAAQEALIQIDNALMLLEEVPRDHERLRLEHRLEGTRSVALTSGQFPTSRIEASMRRMSELSKELGQWATQLLIMQGVTKLVTSPRESRAAEVLIKAGLRQAESGSKGVAAVEMVPLQSLAHAALSSAYGIQGKFRAALGHAERAVETYDVTYQSPAVDSKVHAMAEGAAARWFLGYPARAKKEGAESIAYAEKIGKAPSVGYALARAATVLLLDRDDQKAVVVAEKLIAFSADKDIQPWRSWAMFLRGAARSRLEEPDEGCRAMRSALAELESRDGRRRPTVTTHARASLSFAEARAGLLRPHEALRYLQETIDESIELSTMAMLSDHYRLMGLLKMEVRIRSRGAVRS